MYIYVHIYIHVYISTYIYIYIYIYILEYTCIHYLSYNQTNYSLVLKDIETSVLKEKLK